eukprot:g11314.t1
MSGSSITHFVYPCSGENLWNKILSGDSAKGWRRQIQSTDCLQLSQSKGRLFDSSDPREAVRLMREKELSSEPRHACTRKRDIKQCSKKGPPHFRSSSPFLNGEHFMDAIRKPKITPKVIPNAMELTGRETASDTCIYETSERDRAWSADVEHRWNRPRLTNFWTHNCESRIEFHACSQVNFDWAIKMQEESLRINGKLARLEVPEHRSSMVYKDYYLNQLYKKKRNDRSASTVFGDEKQKLDHKHHYHWTDVNKPFTAGI